MSEIPNIRGHASQQLGLVDREILDDPSSGVVDALEKFETEFTNNVLRFTVEAEVRDYIRQKISESHDSEVELYGTPVWIRNDYKNPYARGLCQPTKADAVRAEVNIGHSSKIESKPDGVIDFEEDQYGGANRSLDVAVLKQGQFEHPVVQDSDVEIIEQSDSVGDSIEVAISAGSKYFPPQSIDTAIEIKYVKDRITPGTINGGDWKKVHSDLEKLHNLHEQMEDPLNPI